MQGEDILSLDSVSRDQHSHPGTNNWILEVIHHIQIASGDQNTAHECHLRKEKTAAVAATTHSYVTEIWIRYSTTIANLPGFVCLFWMV